MKIDQENRKISEATKFSQDDDSWCRFLTVKKFLQHVLSFTNTEHFRDLYDHLLHECHRSLRRLAKSPQPLNQSFAIHPLEDTSEGIFSQILFKRRHPTASSHPECVYTARCISLLTMTVQFKKAKCLSQDDFPKIYELLKICPQVLILKHRDSLSTLASLRLFSLIWTHFSMLPTTLGQAPILIQEFFSALAQLSNQCSSEENIILEFYQVFHPFIAALLQHLDLSFVHRFLVPAVLSYCESIFQNLIQENGERFTDIAGHKHRIFVALCFLLQTATHASPSTRADLSAISGTITKNHKLVTRHKLESTLAGLLQLCRLVEQSNSLSVVNLVMIWTTVHCLQFLECSKDDLRDALMVATQSCKHLQVILNTQNPNRDACEESEFVTCLSWKFTLECEKPDILRFSLLKLLQAEIGGCIMSTWDFADSGFEDCWDLLKDTIDSILQNLREYPSHIRLLHVMRCFTTEIVDSAPKERFHPHNQGKGSKTSIQKAEKWRNCIVLLFGHKPMDSIFELLKDNLSHPVHQVRLCTLQILHGFSLLQKEVSFRDESSLESSQCEDNQELNSKILQCFIELDEMPVKIDYEAERSRVVATLSVLASSSTLSPIYCKILVYGLLGQLFVKYQRHWQAVIQLLASLLINHKEMWSILSAQLHTVGASTCNNFYLRPHEAMLSKWLWNNYKVVFEDNMEESQNDEIAHFFSCTCLIMPHVFTRVGIEDKIVDPMNIKQKKQNTKSSRRMETTKIDPQYDENIGYNNCLSKTEDNEFFPLVHQSDFSWVQNCHGSLSFLWLQLTVSVFGMPRDSVVVEDLSTDAMSYYGLIWKVIKEAMPITKQKTEELSRVLFANLHTQSWNTDPELASMIGDGGVGIEEFPFLPKQIKHHAIHYVELYSIKHNESESKSDELVSQSGRSLPVCLRIRLPTLLSYFSALPKPNLSFKADILQKSVFHLLAHMDNDVRKLALQTLFNFKSQALTPYRDKIEKLVQDDEFREEITKFVLQNKQVAVVSDLVQQDENEAKDTSNSPSVLQEHRSELIPIIIRLLIHHLMKPISGRKRMQSIASRNAVLEFFAGLDSEELVYLVSLLLSPILGYRYSMQSETLNHIESIENKILQQVEQFHKIGGRKVYQRMQSYLSTLSRMIDKLGRKIESFLPHILLAIFTLLYDTIRENEIDREVVLETEEDATDVAMVDEESQNGFTEESQANKKTFTQRRMEKQIRSLAYRQLNQLIKHYPESKLLTPWIQLLFRKVKNSFSVLHERVVSTNATPTIIVLLETICKNPHHFSVFRQEKSILPSLINCLICESPNGRPNRLHPVASSVLTCLENLLEADEEAASKQADSIMPTKEEQSSLDYRYMYEELKQQELIKVMETNSLLPQLLPSIFHHFLLRFRRLGTQDSLQNDGFISQSTETNNDAVENEVVDDDEKIDLDMNIEFEQDEGEEDDELNSECDQKNEEKGDEEMETNSKRDKERTEGENVEKNQDAMIDEKSDNDSKRTITQNLTKSAANGALENKSKKTSNSSGQMISYRELLILSKLSKYITALKRLQEINDHKFDEEQNVGVLSRQLVELLLYFVKKDKKSTEVLLSQIFSIIQQLIPHMTNESENLRSFEEWTPILYFLASLLSPSRRPLANPETRCQLASIFRELSSVSGLPCFGPVASQLEALNAVIPRQLTNNIDFETRMNALESLCNMETLTNICVEHISTAVLLYQVMFDMHNDDLGLRNAAFSASISLLKAFSERLLVFADHNVSQNIQSKYNPFDWFIVHIFIPNVHYGIRCKVNLQEKGKILTPPLSISKSDCTYSNTIKKNNRKR